MVAGQNAMVKYLVILLLLSGCATVGLDSRHTDCYDGVLCVRGPVIEPSTTQQLLNLPYPNQKTVVAVYNFSDLTGQRKAGDNIASFSTAVTQGADCLLYTSDAADDSLPCRSRWSPYH